MIWEVTFEEKRTVSVEGAAATGTGVALIAGVQVQKGRVKS